MKQTIEISAAHAKKLGQIMEMMIDAGVDSITRFEAAEHAIDWTHEILKKKVMKVRARTSQ